MFTGTVAVTSPLTVAIRAVAALLIVVGVTSNADAQQNALNFFKNYFVTGDYVAAGVALRGTGGSGVIDLRNAGVPADADIVGAFLYWQTVLKLQDGTGAGTVGATFEGHPLQNAQGISIAKSVNPNGVAPCWSSGGAAGASNGTHKSITYRADVERYLQSDANGKINVNRTFSVTLPDAGSNGNLTPSTSGATLLLLFRHASRPLRSIVIMDGGFTLDQQHPLMQQTITGFYQAADGTYVSPAAKMTHVVADGQMNFSEQLTFNGVPVGGSDAFGGPAWDTVTVDNLTLEGGASSATVGVTSVSSSYDCLSWSAVVFATNVQDSDEDGLIDLWESSDTPLADPNAGCVISATSPAACFLPRLKEMGADPQKQDIFIELGAMTTGGYKTAIQQVTAHSHLPSKAVLEAVATAFANAPPRPRKIRPTATPSFITGPIRVHFDVGNNYQAGLPTVESCRTTWQASCAILPTSAGAAGGELIAETVGCTTDSTGVTSCGGSYPNVAGTVGWKSGFLLLKNQPTFKLVYKANGTIQQKIPLAVGLTTGSLEQQCLTLGVACERRFDRNRKDIFRYGLLAHALGLTRVDAQGNPILDALGAYQPKNTSGIADGGGVGGADFMVTLGLWDNFTAKPFIQSGTLLHEIGHFLGLRHGGGPPVTVSGFAAPIAQPNCKPNYQSMMNYMFQVRGLVGANGLPIIDLSKQLLGTLTEGNLTENLSLNTTWNPMNYRTSWYAPLVNLELSQIIGPITRRCDGTPLGLNPAMVRVDGTTQNGLIDWNWDGDTLDSAFQQDINFNSAINNGGLGLDLQPKLTFVGYNDFDNIDLRHVGSRRNAGSARIDGALSLDVGFGDVGFGDVGFGDVGFGDVGFGDVGFGDVGFGDVGFGDVGFGDVGFGDVGFGDVGAPPGDLDLDNATGMNAPNSLSATVFSNRIVLNWSAPHIGDVASYTAYKVVGTAITATSDVLLVGTNLLLPATQTTIEDRDVKTNTTYVYFVVARLTDGTLTAPSNFVTVTK